jgi:hypothetical protein
MHVTVRSVGVLLGSCLGRFLKLRPPQPWPHSYGVPESMTTVYVWYAPLFAAPSAKAWNSLAVVCRGSPLQTSWGSPRGHRLFRAWLLSVDAIFAQVSSVDPCVSRPTGTVLVSAHMLFETCRCRASPTRCSRSCFLLLLRFLMILTTMTS